MASLHEEPKPGDLIEIFRTGYSHWALYVGDGYVIHLAPPDEYAGAGSLSISVLSNGGVVKRELLKDVAGDDHYQVNNHLDHKYKPQPVNKILSSAKEMIGKEMRYSVLRWNCEHFVTDLRYGKARSLQAENFLMRTMPVVGGLVVAGSSLMKLLQN